MFVRNVRMVRFKYGMAGQLVMLVRKVISEWHNTDDLQ
jgi:hypothetical protein